MSTCNDLTVRIEAVVRDPRERRVVLLKTAAVGKSEYATQVLRPPCAHVPMQHQAGWQPPIITR